MTSRDCRSAGVVVALVTAALVVVTPANAQTEDEMAGVELLGPRITVAEAVAQTLRNSFNLQQSVEGVEQRRSVTLEAAGLFDKVFFVDSEFTFKQQELLRGGRDQEIKRRVPLEFAAIGTLADPTRGALDQAADAIIAGLPTAGSLLFDDCRLGQTRLLLDLADGSTITLCLNSNGNLDGIVIGGGDPNGVVPGIDVGTLPSGLGLRADDLDELIFLLQVLAVLDAEFLGALTQDLIELFADRLRIISSLLRSVAEVLRIQRARLGDLPRDEQLLNLKLDVGLRRQFRNGLNLTGSIALVGTETNYAGKPLSSGLGDSLAPNTFTTSAGFRLLAPLGRGRGRIATAGPEQAAHAALRAEQRLLIHTASREALATVDAYWRLAAAQERLQLLAESAATQKQILESARALIDADELPGAEIHRVEARYEDALRQVASARQEVVKLRLDLVRTMGQEAARLGTTPLAADPLPRESGLGGTIDAWVEQAFAHRHDLAAAVEASVASDYLARTAKTNLRRQVDLTLDVSFNGLHESFDQRLWDISGFWDALQARGLPDRKEPPLPQVSIAGPSYTAGLRVTIPIKNDVARGRLIKAQAALAKSEITERDLKRRIRLALNDLIGSLSAKRDELAQLEESISYLEDSLEASLELFRAGDLTLIDTLTTEQQLTDARLGVVDAVREIAILQSQIQFEAGQLLVGPMDPGTFDPAQLELATMIGGRADTATGP